MSDPRPAAFHPRTCRCCKVGKGTMSFRWKEGRSSFRDYFHPACFASFRSTR